MGIGVDPMDYGRDEVPSHSQSGAGCTNHTIGMHWINGGVEEDLGRTRDVATLGIDGAGMDNVDNGAIPDRLCIETNNPWLDSTNFNTVFANNTINAGGTHSSVKEGSGTDTTIEMINGIGADFEDSDPVQDIIADDTDHQEYGDQDMFSVGCIEDLEIYGDECSETSEVGVKVQFVANADIAGEDKVKAQLNLL